MKPLLAAPLALLLAALPARAADHEVRMLNYGAEGGMVFEPAFLKAVPGDTVTFVPENSGHFVQSIVLPDGVAPWKSAIDQPFTVTLEAEGLYLYACPPHLMMSMIGLVEVGRPTNRDAVTERAAKLRPKLIMKAERLDALLSQVTAD
ncbi:pseudoazurin [Aureimonas ureilytica]|uniref:pseudoazurin n=1 Tax=Aureimonas ureilytica TaxID=401562 RepID=UPI00036F4E17|nr:pseudoazurin [Aureimonas ureilytica]